MGWRRWLAAAEELERIGDPQMEEPGPEATMEGGL